MTDEELIFRLRRESYNHFGGGSTDLAADRIEELVAREAELEKALSAVLLACDQGKMVEHGIGGMTIDAQIRRSVYNGVPAWPIEEARTALEGKLVNE